MTRDAFDQHASSTVVVGACGGREQKPCGNGEHCEVPAGSAEDAYGVCVWTAPEENIGVEYDVCDNEKKTCRAGSSCRISEGESRGFCLSNSREEKPIILTLMPQSLSLNGGTYETQMGVRVPIVVRAFLVSGGELFFQPKGGERISMGTLESMPSLGSFQGWFSYDKPAKGELIAVMHGKDGQDIDLSVTVSVLP